MKFIRNSLLILALICWGNAQADIVHLDDVIITFSLCVGNDCVNGESFGFDTIRLKENNLRIKFLDTSNTASFPSNDWQITANDSSNGGANKFSIDDVTGGRTPMTIEASAPSHSLYVDDGGRLGLGTSTPVVDVHVKSGNTPTLRLEQDGSSGFTPQTWDVAGNEANFFVRDATNGSTLPFKIKPGAPSNALFIENVTGDIGFGTQAPAAALHVVTSAGGSSEMARFQNNGGSYISFENTSTSETWFFTHENNNPNDFLINNSSAPSNIFRFSSNGDLDIAGEITTSGSCSGGCDRVFADDFNRMSLNDHSEYMWANSHLPGVGATNEEGPFNLSQKVLGMLNELEMAHIYIEQLNGRIEELETALNASN